MFSHEDLVVLMRVVSVLEPRCKGSNPQSEAILNRYNALKYMVAVRMAPSEVMNIAKAIDESLVGDPNAC